MIKHVSQEVPVLVLTASHGKLKRGAVALNLNWLCYIVALAFVNLSIEPGLANAGSPKAVWHGNGIRSNEHIGECHI